MGLALVVMLATAVAHIQAKRHGDMRSLLRGGLGRPNEGQEQLQKLAA